MKLRYKIAIGAVVLVGGAVAALALAISYDADCRPVPVAEAGEVSMRAVVHGCYGSPDVLEVAEIAKPVPGENDILVRVRAAAVNPLDWHYMRGSPYFIRLSSGIGRPEEPQLGVDFAGTVEAVGSGVTRFEVGDDVFGGANGAWAEYVTVAEDRAVAHKPANVSFEEAAAVPIAGVTALQALRDHGAVNAGDAVLINGASGGVGTFAVQIGRALGAEVSGVCSTRNVDLVESLGAEHVFDYKREDYTESGREFDLIVDMVANHPISANLDVLDEDGSLVIVGGPKGNWIAPLLPVVKARLKAPFVEQTLTTMLARLDQDDLAALADMMAAGEVAPVVDRRYTLAEVQDAVRYSETGRARGKIIVDID